MDLSLFIKITPFIVSVLLSVLTIPHMRLTASDKKMLLPKQTEGSSNGMMIGGITFFPIILVALCMSISLPYMLELLG